MKLLYLLRSREYIPLALITTLFFFIYLSHSLIRHFTFNSHAFDLGIYTQAIYLYSQGNYLPFSTLKHMIILADHFGPILAILSPIYKIFPYAETLLVIQALFISLSAIPIYLIAIKELKGIFISILITLGFLSSTATTSSISFDFHLATISVLPLSAILYFWYSKKWILYTVTLFLSILFKEDIPLLLLGLGIFQILQKQFKTGLATASFSLLSLYIIKFNVMPFLWTGGESAYINSLIIPFNSPIDLVSLLLLRPSIFIEQIFNSQIKLLTIDILLKPFAFLPLLSLLAYPTALFHLYLRFSSNYQQTWTTYYHHNAPIVPFLAVSTILAIVKFKLPKYPVALLLIFSLLLSGLNPNSFIWSSVKNSVTISSTHEYINKAWEFIPDNAAVSAQSPLVPHLANREKIYLFPEVYDAQYLVFDKSLSSYPINPHDLERVIDIYSNSTYWKIVHQENTLFVFEKIY